MERDPSSRFPTLYKPYVRPLRAFLPIMSPQSQVPADQRAWHSLERTVKKGMKNPFRGKSSLYPAFLLFPLRPLASSIPASLPHADHGPGSPPSRGLAGRTS